jgi:putative SOS response-associated peptidase YedK
VGVDSALGEGPKIAYKVINARSEILAEKPSFQTALKRRRCLVLTDGFNEWKKDGTQKKGKQPMSITLKDGRPFAFGELWEAWKDPKGEWLKTCTIITTQPNELMATIHDQMPVILPRDAYGKWLTPDDLEAVPAMALLCPYPAGQMKAVPVSSKVNSPATDSPELILRLANQPKLLVTQLSSVLNRCGPDV